MLLVSLGFITLFYVSMTEKNYWTCLILNVYEKKTDGWRKCVGNFQMFTTWSSKETMIFFFLELINLSGNLKPHRIIIQKIYFNRTPSAKSIDRRVLGIDLYVDSWVCLFFKVGVFIKKCLLLQIHIHPHITNGFIILAFRLWKSQLLNLSHKL